MSSVRSAGLFEFYNVGPLTTTFAAPSSCPSPAYYTGVEWPGQAGQPVIGLGFCSTSVETHPECTPSGEAIEDLYKSFSTATSDGPIPTVRAVFHSPGLACPSDWEPVGVVSSKDGSVDASGAFASTVFPYDVNTTTALPPRDFVFNAITSVLEPSETATLCCPSGYTAHPYNGCYSTVDLTVLAGETGCIVNIEGWGSGNNETFVNVPTSFDYFGTTVTGNYFYVSTLTGTEATETGHWTETTRTVTYEFDASGLPNNPRGPLPEVTDATDGLEFANYLLLVNSGEEAEDGDGNGDGNGGGDGENGARPAVGGSSATLVGVVAAVWAVGFLAVCSL